MEYCSAVSQPRRKLTLKVEDSDLTPRPLQINKRKRQPSQHIYREYGSLATGGLVPAAKVRRAVTMSYPPTFLSSQSTWDRDAATHSARPSRAVSLATTQRDDRNHQSGRHDVSLKSRKLSKSISKAEAKPTMNWQSNPESDLTHTVRRLPSFKHRILSRVMNSLIGRSSSSQSVANESGDRRLSIDRSTSNDSPGPTTDGRSSFSSTERSSSIDTNLETALSEFPEPPSSPLEVPIKLSAFGQAPLTSRAYRKLLAPNDVAILHPEIAIIPELASLGSNKNQSLLFASPATLMASCETTRFISSLLDPSNDRMAIICTSSLSADHPDVRTLMPLSCVSPRKTKAIVDTIVSSTERPSSSALDGAVRSARALLEQSTPRDQTTGLGPWAMGHIFVLTPHSSGLPSGLLAHDKIQLHLVNPGSVPWKGEAKVRCNGWRLQSMHSQELRSVRYTKDQDSSSMFNKLRTLALDARKGSLHGGVSDLVLDIKPGRNCIIEGVIGHRNIPSIQPGERVLALVKLKVGLAPAAGYNLRSGRQQDVPNPAHSDPDKELDDLLGTTPVTVLSAKLKYKHSLLPPETQCTLSTDCQLKRPLPVAQWTNHPPKTSAPKQYHPQIEVQKAFVYHIATHHEPRKAMMVLIEEFGDGGRRSACPNYIKLVIEELKYQARTIERFDLADYRSCPVAVTPREMRPDVWGQEHFGQGLFDASDYKPYEWISDAPDAVAIQFPVSAPPKSETCNYTHSIDTTDEARKIWRKMSKKRMGTSSSSGKPSVILMELDEATRRLNNLALRNKRSVGTETLKCLAYPEYQGRAMESCGAPWL
ncbi:MAG: hypothetical protein Q9213_002459 [Squamulea squamosa]